MAPQTRQVLITDMPGRRMLRWLPIAWVAAAAAFLLWRLGAWGYDDAYITYRYSANLAAGAGFVYNAGERVLSTTTPLYAMILALAKLAGADIPRASNAIACACLGLGGLALWRLGQVWRAPVAGATGLLLYPLFPLLTSTVGGEAALYLALILFGFLAYAHERYAWAAALLALAALTRFDGTLAAAVCALHFLIARRRAPPWAAIALYVGLIAAWLLFAWGYFGAPLPVTLAAKQRQGLLPISEGFWPGLLRLARDQYWRFPFYQPYFVLAGLGLVYTTAHAARKRPAAVLAEGQERTRAVSYPSEARAGWLLLVLWSALYAIAYGALGVTSYLWYYAPIVPGFVALVGLGMELVVSVARRYAGRGWAGTLAAALALALLYPQIGSLGYLANHLDTRLTIYRAAGDWLREQTSADASVGSLEVGIIGYYADRRMVDFAGLIQPDVALRLTPSSSYDAAASWAAERYQPDYLVIQPHTLPGLEQGLIPARGCQAAKTLTAPGYEGTLEIYHCPRA